MINCNLEKFKQLSENFFEKSLFSHIVIDNCLDIEFCNILENEFSELVKHTKSYYFLNLKKFELTDYNFFGKNTRKLIEFLNSQEFLFKLESLTGIKNLNLDSSLEGSGLHFTKKDGYLKILEDSQLHIIKKTFSGRLNLFLYFNKNRTKVNNGNAEFWDKDLKKIQ